MDGWGRLEVSRVSSDTETSGLLLVTQLTQHHQSATANGNVEVPGCLHFSSCGRPLQRKTTQVISVGYHVAHVTAVTWRWRHRMARGKSNKVQGRFGPLQATNCGRGGCVPPLHMLPPLQPPVPIPATPPQQGLKPQCARPVLQHYHW